MEAEKHLGHRRRMRDKAENIGLAFLPEHEQLEMILFDVIPRGNTNEIAHELLARFHSIYGVLTADVNELQRISGVGLKVAEYLHSLPSILGIVMRSKIAYDNDGITVLSNVELMVQFSRTLFYDSVSENIYAIFLNKKFKVIKFEWIGSGSMDGVDLKLNEVMRSAVLSNAYYIVLTHNHPSGSSTPSRSDCSVTRRFADAAKAIGVSLLDHIIISDDEYYSFREDNMLR